MAEELLPEEERGERLGGKAPDGKETTVIVTQLACKEDGCPDVELVIRLVRAKPRPKLMFKIYKEAVNVSREELEKALLQAMANETGESAGEAPAKGADGEHGGDCCDGDQH